MDISKHAAERLKERCGLNKWVTGLYFRNANANNMRLYGDKAYIFCGETLVMAIQIPVGLMKDLKGMIKSEKSERHHE